MRDMGCELRVASCELHVGDSAHYARVARRAISLIEILISIFVLLFGLMGVASIFPVGSHLMSEGDKFDSSALLAGNAFEELEVRGMLRPENWLYSDSVPGAPNWVVQRAAPNVGEFQFPIPSPWDDNQGPGHAFVIDPLGTANAAPIGSAVRLPRFNPSSTDNPWRPALAGTVWPVRRVTFGAPDPAGTYPLIPVTTSVAETIFSLRDDLAVELPDEADRPGVQRWSTSDPNNTPIDPTDDLLLARQYNGNYTWLATVVPTTSKALLGLQPANSSYGQYSYDVSVVVFRKRDMVPSATSERLVDAVLLPGREVELFVQGATDPAVLDQALDEIRPGNWICILGVNQANGDFVMKWYRLLSLDDETSKNLDIEAATSDQYYRRAMLIGPDWPARTAQNEVINLRAIVLPGTISAVTRQLQMEL